MTAKVFYSILDNNKLHEGELSSCSSGASYADIETELFAKTKEFPNARAARFRLQWPDGSGHIRCYEKRGDVWVRTYSDNIMPTTFVYGFMFCLLALMAFGLIMALVATYGK